MITLISNTDIYKINKGKLEGSKTTVISPTS
jgi:hypothetical protein